MESQENTPIRSALKELKPNDIMNNKSPIAGPVNQARDDLDDSFFKDPRTQLNATVGQSDLENSYFVSPIPARQAPQKRTSSLNATCDDIIGNFNNFGLATPKRNPNRLSVNQPKDSSYNALSSDEEMFQECESTFDAAMAAKAVLAESGYRSINYNDVTLNNTINFPQNVVNSTLSQSGNGGSSTSGVNQTTENYESGLNETVGTLNGTLDGTFNSTANFVLAPEEANDTFVNDAEAAENVCEITPVDGMPAAADSLPGDETPAAAADQTIDNVDSENESPAEVSSTTAEDEVMLAPEDMCESSEMVNNPPDVVNVTVTEGASTLSSEVEQSVKPEVVAATVESTVTDPDALSLPGSQNNDAANVTITEPTVDEAMPSAALNHTIPIELMSSNDLIVQTAEADSQSELNGTRVINSEINSFDQTAIIASPLPTDATYPLNRTHVLNFDATLGGMSQTVTLASDSAFNSTQVLSLNANIPLNQTVDIAPSVIGVQEVVSDVDPAETVVAENESEMPIKNGKSPKTASDLTKGLVSHSVLPSERLPFEEKPRDLSPKDESEVKKSVVVKQEESQAVDTTFKAFPDLGVAGAEAEAQSSVDQSANNRTANGAEACGRLSIRSDLFGQENGVKTASGSDNTVACLFKVPFPPQTISNQIDICDEDFNSNGMILNPSDFDFLLSKGDSTGNSANCRNSILERFDPLSGPRVSILPPPSISTSLASRFAVIEELESFNDSTVAAVEEPVALPAIADDHSIEANIPAKIAKLDSNTSSLGNLDDDSRAATSSSSSETYATAPIESINPIGKECETATMSVGLIQDMNNENMKSLELVSCEVSDKPSLKMNDNDKKVKHEHAEELEKKLKEAEAREEQLIRRITEKEKQMNKLSSALENYEKTMVEMISEREQLSQNFEKQIAQLKAERDSNQHHLTSLENTFSDLHVKYEKSKQLAQEVKENESKLLEKLEFAQQQIKSQELRYDKLKNHALTQLEGANSKLEALTRNHSLEMKKLTAQMKKEEISRQSMMEQLAQKTKENDELVKICDELINQGPDGS